MRIRQDGLKSHMANFIEDAAAEEPHGEGFSHDNRWERIRFHVENGRETNRKRSHQRRHLHSDILRRRVRGGVRAHVGALVALNALGLVPMRNGRTEGIEWE